MRFCRSHKRTTPTQTTTQTAEGEIMAIKPTPILDREVIQDNADALWEDIHALDYPATDEDPNTVWAFVMFNQPRLAGVNNDE